jgi:hypothetical protein
VEKRIEGSPSPYKYIYIYIYILRRQWYLIIYFFTTKGRVDLDLIQPENFFPSTRRPELETYKHIQLTTRHEAVRGLTHALSVL